MVTDGGELTCHDLKDGTVVWHKEYEDGFYASPIVAGGKLYIVDRKKGIFRVLEVGREAKEIATNPMGEMVSATPAFVGSRIYIRGIKHLWCIAE
jgi:outer membrane protein assembly factor BamB